MGPLTRTMHVVRRSALYCLTNSTASVFAAKSNLCRSTHPWACSTQLHSAQSLRAEVTGSQLHIRKLRNNFRSLATMSDGLKESASNNPGLCESLDEATKGYFLQQTMYRIKDPKASLDFYTRILGMTLLKRLDFAESKFSLYFLGYVDPASVPTDPAERVAFTFNTKATLELTHNWGTETDETFKHHNGNSEPRGYGHIGITVDDTYKACERFEQMGVKFVKKPDAGSMKGLAFIQDPDGYWIEIFDVKGMKNIISSA